MQYKFTDQTTNLEIHLYFKPITAYIIKNYQKLLPNWQKPPKQLIIILFQSQLELKQDNDLTKREKDRLKNRFIQLATDFKNFFDQNLAIVCPQTGKPINCNSGEDNFDIIAVINQALGIEFTTINHCKVLNYDHWKSRVYPCLMVAENDILIDETKLRDQVINKSNYYESRNR